jgi:hypothetical protein
MINNFKKSLIDARGLQSLFEHCVVQLRLPGDYSDLLRMSLVYCLSALDKLLHDLITHEMVEIYTGRRVPTQRYQSENLTFDNHVSLATATVPPAEIIFENIVRTKLSHLCFLDPSKLAEGLSLVWDEAHKWQVIASALRRDDKQVKTELRNLYKRRNAIVHEADRDPSTSQKLPITTADTERARVFIGELGEIVYNLTCNEFRGHLTQLRHP